MKKLLLILFLITLISCEKKIGGETDEYGCLITAGYTYNENVDACIREWELNENQKAAAKIAVNYVGQKGLTIVKVLVARCPGCFAVELQKDSNIINVNLEDWKVVDQKSCNTDSDCVVFGKDGDCNCGCYNKNNLPQKTDEKCFCAAPTSCECVNNKCEGIFE